MFGVLLLVTHVAVAVVYGFVFKVKNRPFTNSSLAISEKDYLKIFPYQTI